MANLASLIEELRRRVSTSSHPGKDEALEAIFRTTLPQFFDAYVRVSPVIKVTPVLEVIDESKFTPVLKLLVFSTKVVPGVFYHGKASAILPFILWILPFFAEPSFRSRHEVVFEAVGSLLSLLRTGDKDAYRHFFVDIMLAVEDVLGAASTVSDEDSLYLMCFRESFRRISCEPSHIISLTPSCVDGRQPGIQIEITGESRWQLLATWLIKLACKCLSEATLYVDGLLYESFVSAACSLLCYDNADLHLVCFELVQVIYKVSHNEVICKKKLIRVITDILNEDEEGSFFSNKEYDSSIGECIHAIFSRCSNDVNDVMDVFWKCMLKTRSPELKNACLRIAVTGIWHEMEGTEVDIVPSTPEPDDYDSPRVGKRRLVHDQSSSGTKRLRMDKEAVPFNASFCGDKEESRGVKKEYCEKFKEWIFSLTGFPIPSEGEASVSGVEVLTNLSMLSLVCCEDPYSKFSRHIFGKISDWIAWICEQAELDTSLPPVLKIFLEAVHYILLVESNLAEENKAFQIAGDNLDLMLRLLKLPWINKLANTESTRNIKCLSLQVWSKMGCLLESGSQLDVLDLGIHDKVVEVRAQAVICMTITVSWSAFVEHIFKRLPVLEEEKDEQARLMISLSIGYLGCIIGSYRDGSESNCKLYIAKDNFRHFSSADNLLQGFWCSKCDKDLQNLEMYSTMALPEAQSIKSGFEYDLNLQSLFFKLINDDSSEKVQVSCVGMIQRILYHVCKEVLLEARSKWIDCIRYLLLHPKRSVREAFSKQVNLFTEEAVLSCLFLDDEEHSREQKFLDEIIHALEVANDPDIIETLLVTCAQILVSVDIEGQFFLLAFGMLVDFLDNADVLVRWMASKLIRESCYFHVRGGLEQILVKVLPFRIELYRYLCLMLRDRPQLVSEFAEAVLLVQTQEFVEEMVPLVLPQLVINNEVLALNKLASFLDTNMVDLTLKWSPKVLAFALNRADGEDLVSALQFYHAETGFDKQKIFSSAFTALLVELVCFIDVDFDEANKRLSLVPQVLKQVASILTGNEDLPSILKNHFFDLLKVIDTKMLHTQDISLQKQAMKRIEMLIDMMGSHLSTYVPKVMALLMYNIENESLQTEALCALHFFVKRLVEVSPSSAKHVISQVFASLLPLLPRDERNTSSNLSKIVEILKELVFKNKDIIKKHIHGFLHLPCISSLKEVNKVIKEARGSMLLEDILSDIVAGLKHENLNVRYMVAYELRGLLILRREEVTSFVASHVGSDIDKLSSLINVLLRGCTEESGTSVGQQLKLVCAECLGALGAVDPAKVKDYTSDCFKVACLDHDLIFELIDKHLARAFRAAPNTSMQDSAALAIQELLRIAGWEASLDDSLEQSSGVPKTGKGLQLWGQFSDYVKEIITPCLTSKIELPDTGDSASPGPIYQPSMPFRSWICFWIKRLSAHAAGTREGIFTACRGIVCHDVQTATYLLPYLVVNALCHGTEEVRHGIAEEILCVLDAPAASVNNMDAIQGNNSSEGDVCIQSIFTLLDNLGQWVDDVEQLQDPDPSQSIQSVDPEQQASSLKDTTKNPLVGSDLQIVQCKYVSELLKAISKEILARASLRCQAYARSLFYFESYVRDKSGSFNPAAKKSGVFLGEDVSFLMEVYSNLDEPDVLSGLTCFKRRTLQDGLLINKKAGKWNEVLQSCEQALRLEPHSVHRNSDVLNCLLNMSQLRIMATRVDGLISRVPKDKKTWCMHGVQAAWRLGLWDQMDEYLDGAGKEDLLCSSSESNASFDMDVAKILQVIMKKDQFAISEKIEVSRQALLAPLSAAGMASYTRAYPIIVKLHMLRELDDFQALLEGKSFLEKSFTVSEHGFAELTKNWEDRLRYTQPSLSTREPLLAFRRLVFYSSGLGDQVGNYWLQYAKLCRSAGNYEAANMAVMEANVLSSPNSHKEKAKVLWSTGKPDSAIYELQQHLLDMPTEVSRSVAMESISGSFLAPENGHPLLRTDAQFEKEKSDIAKTLLLYTKWNHCTGQKQKEDVHSLYNSVIKLQPCWEKGYFYMAKYCDELLADARKRQEKKALGVQPLSRTYSSSLRDEKPWWSDIPNIMNYYSLGLSFGHKYLFQALPRLLTLWFEFGSIYQRSSTTNKDLETIHKMVMEVMRECSDKLPSWYWLTVLPQLVSRICHENGEIVCLVKELLASVLQKFPPQALWMMAAPLKSQVASRRDAAEEIIHSAKNRLSPEDGNRNLCAQFTTFIDHLIRLCSMGVSEAGTDAISAELRALRSLMPLDIIMPLQKSLSVNLPTYPIRLDDSLGSGIFSSTELPTITGISDDFEILPSRQKPIKVFLMGSDGIQRPFLCKPMDDLRKDARMMEFSATVNRLLSKCPESRRRKLHIRTFAVIPLKEDCGLVECVLHTRALRDILDDIYFSDELRKVKTYSRLQEINKNCGGNITIEILENDLLPMFPPRFHEWFLRMFSKPDAWFTARVAYAQTTAIWSMVGHIVGLGNRHGGNVLFDSTTGDCVHFNFGVLFDRGLRAHKPELVPFRLTQNIIDGLGITGYEGVFSRVCEITLSVLRAHKETLMSVLESFIHDPLMEWTEFDKSSQTGLENPHAKLAISNIEARLKGVVVGVGAQPSLTISVRGQARHLIAEAVSHKNLAGMHFWWMPWF